ncbi:hypothetical protein SASPL_139763 [Salvia splendens]|uniref:Tyrosine-protein kinase catalytic domain-containing protein n=1 Tax=Salvia splendens TaxID=180675 RepID=A0A8X8ZAQ6_SALSN|nr:hypothetical protein SASPL_139763 [Salvia splendens]
MGLVPKAMNKVDMDVGNSKARMRKIVNGDGDDDASVVALALALAYSMIGISAPAESKSTNETSRDQPVVPVVSSSATSNAESVPSTPKIEEELKISSQLRKFTYNELKLATRSFRPDSLLGEGGFGCVFKGWVNENGNTPVKPGTGLTVAVKTLNHDGLQGHKEWLIVALRSLPLPWAIRMKIALNAAKGLAFLHEEAERPVIYRDFKTSNILLDVRRRFYRLIDPRLEGCFSVKGAQKTVQLAARCLSRDAKIRPAMSEIVLALEPLPALKDMACSSSYFQAMNNARGSVTMNARTGGRLQTRNGQQPTRSPSMPNRYYGSPYQEITPLRSPLANKP